MKNNEFLTNESYEGLKYQDLKNEIGNTVNDNFESVGTLMRLISVHKEANKDCINCLVVFRHKVFAAITINGKPSTKSSKDTGTSSSGTINTGTSSTVSKQLKSLISCLTSTSKATGSLPTSSQYKTCQVQSSAETVGGSTVGSGKTGGGLVPSNSGVVGSSFLGSTGKVKTGSSSSTSP